MTNITDITAGGPTTINYDSFFTSTIKNYSSALYKNFLKYRPSVEMLMDDFGHKDTAGGRIYQSSVAYGQNTTTKFFDGADSFGQEPAQTALPLIYQWRYIGSTVSMTQTEMLENSNQAQLFDLAETRIDQALRTINLILGQENFSDGTNYNGKTIVGLAAAVSTTPSTDPSSGALGGIPAATANGFWQNTAVTSCGSFAVNGVNGSTTDLVLNTYNLCTDGTADGPTDFISDQATLQYYNKTLLQTVRILDPNAKKTGDLSYGNLMYMGMPWTWDRQCPTGRLYMLNRKYIHYMVDPRYLFKWTQPLTYPNQLAYTRIVGLRVSLCTKARMFMAVMDGWTA